jgi:hypothetical protein
LSLRWRTGDWESAEWMSRRGEDVVSDKEAKMVGSASITAFTASEDAAAGPRMRLISVFCPNPGALCSARLTRLQLKSVIANLGGGNV